MSAAKAPKGKATPTRPPALTKGDVEVLLHQLNVARSAVFVCTAALDTGDDHSDLELQAATLLKRAYSEMDFVYDKLLMARVES